MSIVPLQRVTLVGLGADRDAVLEGLQRLGCLEIIKRTREELGDALQPELATEVREALKFLLGCPDRRRQFQDDTDFNPVALEAQALALRDRLRELNDELDSLRERRELIVPWGDFEFPELGDVGLHRLWFYRVPHHRVAEFNEVEEPWEILYHDPWNAYIVVISAEEPEDTPVQRERVGARSRHQLEQRIQQVEIDIEKVQEKRAQLTHWCQLLGRKLALLEDRAELRAATRHTAELDTLFGLEAWMPQNRAGEVRKFAREQGLALEERAPLAHEQPPTKMENPPLFNSGEALVNFYMTPGYWTWDPSTAVLLSFGVFFAMILADAGYALLLVLPLALGWHRLGSSDPGRWLRRVGSLCIALSLAYGVIIGSYFGLNPAPGSALARVVLIDIGDSASMMTLTIAIGVLHMVYACVRNGQRFGKQARALAPLGWAAAIAGGALYSAAELLSVRVLALPGALLVAGGLLLVVVFTAVGEKPLPRLLQGLLALTRVTGAFGDVLSYLRLFALGLASASLASAFNTMATTISAAMPGLGLFLALLVLALGHALNLLLGVASAVIHGLRLNVIEFFNWGLVEEGRLFRPFRKKES